MKEQEKILAREKASGKPSSKFEKPVLKTELDKDRPVEELPKVLTDKEKEWDDK